MASASTESTVATATDFEWTEEQCLQLIKEFRAKPMLWDKTSPFYYKRQMRPDAWEEIGKALKRPSGDCKYKMNVLISSFRREKAKIAANLKSKDRKNHYRSNWFAFKEMSFCLKNSTKTNDTTDDNPIMASLLNVTQSKQPKRSVTSTHKEKNIQKKNKKVKLEKDEQKSSSDVEVVYETEPEEILPTLAPAISIAQAEPSQLPKLTPMISVTQFQTVAQMHPEPPPQIQQRQDTQPTNESEEEINSFATFIATKMKKLSQYTKNMVQKEICEVIFKADQGFYDRTNDESHNSGYTDVRQFHADHRSIKNEYDDD